MKAQRFTAPTGWWLEEAKYVLSLFCNDIFAFAMQKKTKSHADNFESYREVIVATYWDDMICMPLTKIERSMFWCWSSESWLVSNSDIDTAIRLWLSIKICIVRLDWLFCWSLWNSWKRLRYHRRVCLSKSLTLIPKWGCWHIISIWSSFMCLALHIWMCLFITVHVSQIVFVASIW